MSEPRITKIIYREYPDDLFDGQDVADVERAASAGKFLDHLGAELRTAYPGVLIVLETATQPVSEWQHLVVETEPTPFDDDEEIGGAAIRLEEETEAAVTAIAAKIYEDGDWYADAAPPAQLQFRIDDALLHYSIGRETAVMVGQTFVDWRYVADQMAAALRGETPGDPSALTARPAGTGH